MTTCLGKSCSFGLLRVSFVNVINLCVYVLLSFSVVRVGCGIGLYYFLLIVFLFTLNLFVTLLKPLSHAFSEATHFLKNPK